MTRQDEWALDRMGRYKTFVEVGAYDGFTHSNTLMLEKQYGWTGHLVEAWKPFAELCQANRPFCIVHNAFIGSGGIEPFIVGGEYSGSTDHMPAEFLEEHRARKNQIHLMPTKSLVSVIGRGPFDYLSLDTEGGEYEILGDWLRAGGVAHGITAEFRYDQKEFARLNWLAKDFGYLLDDVRGFDLCFLKEDWDDNLFH